MFQPGCRAIPRKRDFVTRIFWPPGLDNLYANQAWQFELSGQREVYLLGRLRPALMLLPHGGA